MRSAVRILLIAASERSAAWIRETLREAGRHTTCVHAANADSAKKALGERAFDLVVYVHPTADNVHEALATVDGRGLPLLVIADSLDDVPAQLLHQPGVQLCRRGAGVEQLAAAVEAALGLADERTQGAHTAAFEAGQREILEAIAARAPLNQVLEQIVVLVERQAEGMICSILLVDPIHRVVHPGAGPHLPPTLMQGIDGAEIGPQAGSCGTAAYRRERVIVEDIGTHPAWAAYRHLALPYGLRASWSTPIFSPDRSQVLGTFAMYYLDARGPTTREIAWVDRATHLAAIAIARDRAERDLRDSEARYRQIVDTAFEGVWLFDSNAHTLFANQRTAELLGRSPGEMVGHSVFEFMDDETRTWARGDFLERLRTVREQQMLWFRRKDGSRLCALMSGSPIHNQQGELTGALGMLTDITDLKAAERALRQSEAEFRVLFESAAIGMALVDADGRALRANLSLQHALGYTESELRRKKIVDLVHPEDARESLELARGLLQGRRDSYQHEARFFRKDGTLVWVRLTASLVRESGGTGRAIAMIENITERRQMEESVRSSERLRTLMYHAVTDVLFYLGVEPEGQFRFLSVNPAFSRTTGIDEGAVVGRLVTEVVPEPSLSLVLANYRRAIAERRMVTWDEVSSYPAGVRHGEVSVAPVFDASGVCTHLVGSVHDVTQNRLAQQRIAAQAALLDKARDAIMVRTLDGKIEYWSHGAERLYGWSPAEAIGRDAPTLTGVDPAMFAWATEQTLAAGAWSGELVLRSRSGQRLVVEASWTLLRDEAGRPRSVLAINTDVTERRRLETLVMRGQRLESLGVLAGGIAHDFNNILTAISGNLVVAEEMLRASHPAREPLAATGQAITRAKELIGQILTFSRQREPRRERIRLAPVIEEALRLLRVGRAGIKVEARLAPDLPPVLADATQMHQVVMNLGTNAAQAMGGRGTLRISADRVVLSGARAPGASELPPGEYVRLTVADTGNGMDEATIEHIFDPFFTTKAEGDGTGLGLSVVHGIVKSHNGAIAVTSKVGLGTEFNLYLPASQGTAPERRA
jgi:PAS domain S-box-containing protein